MRLSALDLNLLVVLDAVLAERSVARAARRLHLTPSAISNALARLRAALRDPLVVRSGRGIAPTPRAAALGPAIARALRDLDRAVHDGFDPATTERELTVAIADAGQLVKLPRICTLLAREMPRARLRVIGIDALVTAGGLSRTEVDVMIGLGERGPGIHVQPLYEEPAALVARVGHPRAGRRVSKTVLGELRHVDVQVVSGRGYRGLAASYARLAIPRETAVVVPTFAAAAAVVAASDLVATLPVSLIDVLGPRLGFRRVRSPVPQPRITLNLVWHERTHDDPAARAFRDLVTRAVAGTT